MREQLTKKTGSREARLRETRSRETWLREARLRKTGLSGTDWDLARRFFEDPNDGLSRVSYS